MSYSNILETRRNIVLVFIKVPKGKRSTNQEYHYVKEKAGEERHQENPDYSQEVLQAISVGGICPIFRTLEVCGSACGRSATKLYADEGQSPEPNENEYQDSHCKGSQEGAWFLSKEVSTSFEHNYTNLNFPLEATKHYDYECNHKQEADPSKDRAVIEAENSRRNQQNDHEHYHRVKHAFWKLGQQDYQQY